MNLKSQKNFGVRRFDARLLRADRQALVNWAGNFARSWMASRLARLALPLTLQLLQSALSVAQTDPCAEGIRGLQAQLEVKASALARCERLVQELRSELPVLRRSLDEAGDRRPQAHRSSQLAPTPTLAKTEASTKHQRDHQPISACKAPRSLRDRWAQSRPAHPPAQPPRATVLTSACDGCTPA